MMSLYISFRIYDTKRTGEIIEKRKQVPQHISRKLLDKANQRIRGNMNLSLLLTCINSFQVHVPFQVPFQVPVANITTPCHSITVNDRETVNKNNSCPVPGRLDKCFILNAMFEKFREAEKKQWQMGWFILSQILGSLCIDEEELFSLEYHYVQRAIIVLRRQTCAGCGVCSQRVQQYNVFNNYKVFNRYDMVW